MCEGKYEFTEATLTRGGTTSLEGKRELQQLLTEGANLSLSLETLKAHLEVLLHHLPR